MIERRRLEVTQGGNSFLAKLDDARVSKIGTDLAGVPPLNVCLMKSVLREADQEIDPTPQQAEPQLHSTVTQTKDNFTQLEIELVQLRELVRTQLCSKDSMQNGTK
ncbi:hypothetical protein AAFF_G00064160 [Aldrovandia affinis]|uniref:Uncharacterized protein n=1 Tax=Aldrovandia affinis TaxID=143900 RepID=A0AAD7WYN1_9TELE|nr:hypothetical protein AAFF_G00064160 [Aldrovandia affinis]